MCGMVVEVRKRKWDEREKEKIWGNERKRENGVVGCGVLLVSD